MDTAQRMAILIAPCNLQSPEFYLIECAAHGVPWSRNAFTDCSGQHYRATGLWHDNAPAGFCISRIIAGEITLMNIAVHPAAQGHGFGSLLLQDLVRFASDQHGVQHSPIFLEVRESNTAALALYKKWGFQNIGRRPGYYPPLTAGGDAETAIVMRRSAETPSVAAGTRPE